MTVLMAVTLEQASRVTGLSERRLRDWDRTGVLRPSLARDDRGGAYGRIYAFRDLVGLRVLGELRDRCGFSPQKLRLVGDWLARHDQTPWATLRFSVQGDDIVFDQDSGAVVSVESRGQAAFPFCLEEIARQTEADVAVLAERRSDQIGEITRNRHVMSNAPVLAGTRIPTAAIWDFHRAGYDSAAIVEEYPRLTALDVKCAIAFERDRRSLPRTG